LLVEASVPISVDADADHEKRRAPDEVPHLVPRTSARAKVARG
jgi:hypothetical protein